MQKTISKEEWDKINRENKNLKALVQSFYEVNTSIDLDTVLDSTLKQASELMNAEICSIALLNDDADYLDFVKSTDPNFTKLKKLSVPVNKGLAGHVARTGKTIRVDDVHNDERFYGKIDEAMKQTTTAYICTPLIVQGKVIGTAQLMNRKDGGAFLASDALLLEGFAHQAALAIHNANMHKVMLQQKVVDAEMGICSDIQKALFPKQTPDISGFHLLGMSQPARAVGGDYYTYVYNQDGSYDVVIADISGKGVSAALMVSEFHTGYHLLAQQGYELNVLYDHLNAHLLESLPTGHFITSFAMRVSPDTSKINYILAGHNPPIVLKGKETFELERTGVFLGLGEQPFTQKSFTLEKGDLITAFSDGLPEARNANFDLFEERRIEEALKQCGEYKIEGLKNELLMRLDVFRGEEPLPDDLTLVLMRRV